MNRKGFTLVEVAIVLIIIGIILGMVFKGRQLIDSAKIKSLETNYNKIQTAVNTFYDRYGFYPGDGCNANETSPANCSGTKNGLIDTSDEYSAFWTLLIDGTGLLTAADRKTITGNNWDITYSNVNGKNADWLKSSFDTRYICDLDRKIDDGVYNSGIIQAAGRGVNYNTSVDCWSLSGTVPNGYFYLLP